MNGKQGSGAALSGLLGVAALAGGAFLLGRYFRRIEEEAEAVAPAAFSHPMAVPGAFDQTRDAGPAHMRDEQDDDVWDEVDEGSDESFPASDPPAFITPRSFE